MSQNKEKTIYDKNINCSPDCVYFPNMECVEKDWEYSDANFCKIRKTKKIFKCLYDLQPIDWERQCPYKIEKAKSKQTDSEMEK